MNQENNLTPVADPNKHVAICRKFRKQFKPAQEQITVNYKGEQYTIIRSYVDGEAHYNAYKVGA